MTSEAGPAEAYVWVWLPGAADPVVAGRLELVEKVIFFNYGRSYLARDDAIALYLPELPLGLGRIRPPDGMSVAGCINDAGPDGWGQRVIMHRLLGSARRDTEPATLSALTYLLESGSDRIGALDFQASATEYVPRVAGATLAEMLQAAERLEAGETFTPELDHALLRGSSIGGARPKVLLDDHDDNKKYIAKFSSVSDPYPVVKAEAVAMELARRVGLDVAPTRVERCLNRDVLLVERFDRTPTGSRRMLVSALTILGLDEMAGRHASYVDLAEVIRARFTNPQATLHELFTRIVFNICVGNTDDHARNHAAFWDGGALTLTPAYDICPQGRVGGEAAQAMAFGRNGFKFSQLAACVDAAPIYLLSEKQARDIIDQVLHVIEKQWKAAADAARLTKAERAQLSGRDILNPYALQGYRTPK